MVAVAVAMAPMTAAEKKQGQLLIRRASLEQQLRLVRMELKEQAIAIMRERKEKAKVAKEKVKVKTTAGTAVSKAERLRLCTVTGGMVGWSRDGKTRFGPGHECWQRMHRARGGKGGHKHTCGKVPYTR